MEQSNKAFYEHWAISAAGKPDRENKLKWKAVNLANLYLRTLKNKSVASICEIGGAEGIVLHTLGDILNAKLRVNFELSTEFCNIGKARYPDIHFENSEFTAREERKYDLIVLSDIIEHVEDETEFLHQVSKSCQYALLKIPIEECLTTQPWYYRVRGKSKPSVICYGPNHENGHLRGYSVRTARKSISRYFQILDANISEVSYFYGPRKHHLLKHLLGVQSMVWLFGGALFLLGESISHPNDSE